MDDRLQKLIDDYVDAKIEELRPSFEAAYEEVLYGSSGNGGLYGLGAIVGRECPAPAKMPKVLTRQLRRQAERALKLT